MSSVQPSPPALREGTARTSPEALIGQLIDGRLRVLSLISRGSMGAVYRAEQVNLGRVVAVKVVSLDTAYVGADEQASADQRFMNEAATLARLAATNTVRIYDFGVWRGRPYLVMEYIAGQNLASVLQREGALAPERALDIAVQICRSLREAHRIGVIHRDLKPANILVTVGEDGELVKVVDFGLVKGVEDQSETTSAGRLVGSPNYMSPEHIREDPVDPRSDIYSVGLLLFRMLTGHLPFDRQGTVATLVAHLEDEPTRLADRLPDGEHLPEAFEWTVATCLKKDPDDRFASVDEFRKALEACRAVLGMPDAAHVQPRLVDGRTVLPEGVLDWGGGRPTDLPLEAPPLPSAPSRLLKLMLGMVVFVLSLAVVLLLLDPGPI